jgi:hypothetical protein
MNSMSKRLMGWKEISAEKITRSRAWLKARAKTDPAFPKPAVNGAGQSPTLFWEHDVDAWLEHYAKSVTQAAASKKKRLAPHERSAAGPAAAA